MQKYSYENSELLIVKEGESKVVVRKSELDMYWSKFHESKEMGSHQGINAMEQRMKRYYILKKREWLTRKSKECKVCEQVKKKKVVPASAPFLADAKEKLWQMDYIGKFPPDAQTGHW